MLAVPVHLAEWQIAAAYAAFAIGYVVFALGKLPGMKIDRLGVAELDSVTQNPDAST